MERDREQVVVDEVAGFLDGELRASRVQVTEFPLVFDDGLGDLVDQSGIGLLVR
jgi:hypothetical protein